MSIIFKIIIMSVLISSYKDFKMDMATASETSSTGNVRERRSEFSYRFHHVCKRFADRTSMHGFGYFETSRHFVSKIFWLLATLVAVGVLIMHLYMIITQYITWPKKTSVTLGYANLRFPAVTICNMNILKKTMSSNYASKQFNELIQISDPDYILKTLSSFSTESPEVRSKRSVDELYTVNWSTIASIESFIASADDENNDDDWDTSRATLSLLMHVLRYEFMLMPREDRAAVGHNMSDMLIDCSFSGKTCFASNFTLFQTPTYGNCYTLDSDKMMSKTPGPDGGLSVVLYLQTNEYIKGITQGFGIKVAIHDPGTIPVIDDEGAFVAAASETNIALKQTSITRLGTPYGNCRDGTDFATEHGFRYNVKTCYVACLADHIWNNCSCWHYIHEFVALRSNKTFNICNTTAEQTCLYKTLNLFHRKMMSCSCDNPCTEKAYSLSISGRQWPSQEYATLLKAGVCNTSPQECLRVSRLTDQWSISNNFVRLNIFFETLNFESIVEEPLIDPFTFMSSIGGALGLWIGLSMLSVCEVLQLAGEICMCIFIKIRDRRKFDQ